MNVAAASAPIIRFAFVAIILVALAFFVSEPIPQDPAYHAFEDNRLLFGIPNFLNVISNLPLLVAGAWGVSYVLQHGERVCAPTLRSAYLAFFEGVLLSALGSCYYHIAPDNETLVWDRLPMTIAFAGLFVIILGEYVSVHAARKLLLPLLLAGAASVAYWAITEASGSGDLRPYAAVQFLPMLIIPVILLLYRSETGSSLPFWLIIVFYFVAKVFENFDAAVFGMGGWASGHTLKHVVASLAPLALLFELRRRNSKTAS